MHKRFRRKMVYHAKILVAIGIALLAYGVILNFTGDYRLIDPVKDVITEEEDTNIIHVDTNDDTVIKVDNSNDSDKDKQNPTTNNNNNITNNSNNNKPNTSNNNNNNQNQNSSTPSTPAPQPHVQTIEDVNNDLRNQLQKKYNINILYGAETINYKIGNISTYPITDSTTVNSQLSRLDSTLSLYPRGLFSEIKSGGIPLTIILVGGYSEPRVTGITDSNYSYAKISISAAYSFEESFFHESYHYIERYLFKNGASFASTWNVLNPPNSYTGTIDTALSYDTAFSPTAPFVNDYAQVSAEEDRASTFEYMMASSKASCLNSGNTVWRKAKVIADTIDVVLNTVSPYSVEYWERFL